MYYPELPENSDDAVLDFIDTTREEDIPVDGFQLSSGYCAVETSEGIKRCTFTWNYKRFKDALLQYGCRSLWNDNCGLLMSFYLFRMPVLYCHTILLLIYTFCLLLSSILVCAVI